MSKLNADAISNAVYELEDTARAATIKDILIDLRDSLKSGMTSEDTDGSTRSGQPMSEPYVVIVSGWRAASPELHAEIISDELYPIYLGQVENVILRHGKCKHGGVDLIVDGIARGWGWQVDPMPAEERDGRVLGSARNRSMCAKEPRARELIAFPGPGSTGTWDCMKWAARYGIPFHGIPLRGRRG